jgi:DNA-binding HxlR family transcriptional regulator
MMKDFSIEALVKRLKDLDEIGIVERCTIKQTYNEISPKIEYSSVYSG